MMTLFQELKARNLIAQTSHEKEIEELLDTESVKFYTGFDATADSLHIGGLLQLITMRRFQNAGHYPIALLGTATSLIGDPTGKTDMRKMLTSEEIAHNAERFREQMSRIVDFTDGKAEIVMNGDWFADVKYLDFLGSIGRHFSVNKMLTAECFKSRFEGKGLSFLEFNYMLLQSYDFLHLYINKGVKLEMGGDDQWSNILAGADLVRRV
ncbi:MAG: tyrosine--tRNA ligase, partial [Oscillospiraceae bacterium]|nr:tyrosine--tRNA ligase [Oscillospiraceae bacterium]